MMMSTGGSGGPVSIVSTNEFAVDIAVHETGHTFADLADEYDTPAPQITPVEKANATRQTSRSLIKWSSWILPETPIPTPETINSEGYPIYDHAVGLFDGANYNPTGWYRPKYGCKMNFLSYPFCEVCAETLTLNIYKRLSVYDNVTPATGSVTVPEGGSTKFEVATLTPLSHAISVQWFLDNTAASGATGDTFTISNANASPGQHTLRADIFDATPLVRNDPSSYLRKSVSWSVSVPNGTAPSPAPVLNVSTRLRVERGEKVLIGGFIITGAEAKKVIVRAIGPSLGDQGVPGVLLNPMLELINGDGFVVGSNDDWRIPQAAEVEATGIPPARDAESAIVITLTPGPYTAKVTGKADTIGVGLVEVYDLQQADDSQLANISTRGFIRTGDDRMIGGFIVGPRWSGEPE